MKFETLAIHAGQEPDPNNGAVMTPVYFTSTYMQDGIGKPRQGYEYSRTLNPTRKALQDCLAELEAAAGDWLLHPAWLRQTPCCECFQAVTMSSQGMMYMAARSAC